MKEFKVKVVKYTKGWYINHVGEVFTVTDTPGNDQCYRLLKGNPYGEEWGFYKEDCIIMEKFDEIMKEYKGFKLLKPISLLTVWKESPCTDDWNNFFKEMADRDYDWNEVIFPKHCIEIHDSWNDWFLAKGFMEKVEKKEALKMEVWEGSGVAFSTGGRYIMDASTLIPDGFFKVWLSDFNYTINDKCIVLTQKGE